MAPEHTLKSTLRRSAPLLKKVLPAARIRKLVPIETWKRISISLKDFKAHPPILVYQVGKVGSGTVHKSLLAARIPNPVYHIHVLSDGGIEWAEGLYKSATTDTFQPSGHVRTSRFLRKRIDREKDIHWRIVTGVREPVRRSLSEFFQTVDWRFPELLDDRGNLREDEAYRFLSERLPSFVLNERSINWFDLELKSVFGVDVFETPFDHEKGYSIIEQENVRVLVIRQEDLSRCFTEAMSRFLPDIPTTKMVNANVSSNSRHWKAYKSLMNRLRISEEVAGQIYSSRLVRHFYTDEMIEGFKNHWTRSEEPIPQS